MNRQQRERLRELEQGARAMQQEGQGVLAAPAKKPALAASTPRRG